LAALRIDLVGTTADFRRFSPRHPLPINHLSCENSGMRGRIGEVRLTAEWQADYDAWQNRDLSARRYVYVWADGVYLQAPDGTGR